MGRKWSLPPFHSYRFQWGKSPKWSCTDFIFHVSIPTEFLDPLLAEASFQDNPCNIAWLKVTIYLILRKAFQALISNRLVGGQKANVASQSADPHKKKITRHNMKEPSSPMRILNANITVSLSLCVVSEYSIILPKLSTTDPCKNRLKHWCTRYVVRGCKQI